MARRATFIRLVNNYVCLELLAEHLLELARPVKREFAKMAIIHIVWRERAEGSEPDQLLPSRLEDQLEPA